MTVLQEVRSLLPELRARAGEVEVGGVEVSVLTRLHATGFFAMMRPKRYGGGEADPAEFYEIVREISAACGSTGWVASLLGVHPWHLALFDDRAQDEVWGADPRAVLAAAYAPGGLLTPRRDGFELTGRWRFCTGVHHASWVMLGALLLGDDGDPVDFMAVLLPSTDYTIEETWDGVGLRGIGADDVAVTGAQIPPHRVFGSAGRTRQQDRTHAARLSPLHRLPYPTVFTHAVTVPLLGAAEGAYLSHLAEGGDAAAGRRAASDIRVSWLQMQANLSQLMAHARANTRPDDAAVLTSRRDQVMGCDRAVRAVDVLLDSSGRAAFHRDHPLQRAWRDTHTGRTHGANDIEQVLSVFGRWAYGLSIDDRWW